MKKISRSDVIAVLLAAAYIITVVYMTNRTKEERAKTEMLKYYPYEHSKIPTDESNPRVQPTR